MQPQVIAVHASQTHSFSKSSAARIRLIAGLGVEGDAHCGSTVKHRSRVARDPTQPNLRQVHLVASELFEVLAGQGFEVAPGQIGENITTRGVDLLGLPRDTELRIGTEVLLRVTGLRNPCVQLDRFQLGLMSALLDRTPEGETVRKAGVMAVVVTGGMVQPGDAIAIRLPSQPHAPLQPV